MFAFFLSSMPFPAPVIAIGALIIVLPCTLFVLGLGFVVQRIWNLLSNERADHSDKSWRFFKRFVLGSGALAWLLLTLIIMQAPTGPRNETVAVALLRTINTAEVTYLSGNDGYATISELIGAGLLDERYTGPMSGYVFEISASGSGYTATAMPVSTKTGKYGYYTTSDGVVRYAESAQETCSPCFPRGMAGAPTQ